LTIINKQAGALAEAILRADKGFLAGVGRVGFPHMAMRKSSTTWK
jgi:hypothetical protein